MDIRVAAENALIVYLAEDVSPAILSRVRRLSEALEHQLPLAIIDLIPGYHSITVVYDPRRITFATLKQHILSLDVADTSAASEGAVLELPAYYSAESGPDLQRVADYHGITPEQVIRHHCDREYLVYAVGFAPGFAYLGELDEHIATPRHKSPRLQVPRGAVAIADRQTAVYPAESPGGWNLIGLCPTTLFDPQRQPPMPCGVGDRVRFRRVSRAEFLALGGTL